MTPKELAVRYEADMDKLKSFGERANKLILKALQKELGNRAKVGEFVQIPPKPRVKSLDSLTAKAFYRGHKSVADPYTAITDKVGIRYVVAVEDDVATVGKVIFSCHPEWTVEKGRDFQEERLLNTSVFGYQSDHYWIKWPRQFGEIICEVQVPTLLQHTYNAVTHDTVYKPLLEPSKYALRLCARCMGLMEAADDFFMRTHNIISEQVKDFENTLSNCVDIYRSAIDPKAEADRQTSVFMYQNLLPFLQPHELAKDQLADLFTDHSGLARKIKEKRPFRYIYRQPIVLLLLYVADKYPTQFADTYRGDPDDVDWIKTDVNR